MIKTNFLVRHALHNSFVSYFTWKLYAARLINVGCVAQRPASRHVEESKACTSREMPPKPQNAMRTFCVKAF